MAKKKKTSRKATSTRIRARKTSRRETSRFGRFVLPLAISAMLISGLAFFGFSSYQTATGSSFFKVQKIDIRGSDRTPADDIRRIVATEVEKPGVWNVDLADIRTKIEKFPFVKAAAVSR